VATLQQIRDAIAAKISGVAGTGMVNSFERYARDMGALNAVYSSGGLLKGWHVRRVATARRLVAMGRTTVTHDWELRAVMALNDATQSELAFDAMIEAVDHAFRDDDTLGGVVGTTRQASTGSEGGLIGLQVKDSGPAMFAGVLVHLAICGLATWHTEGGG
jgi:hypothetical protein